MKRLNILWIGLISVLMTACYDDMKRTTMRVLCTLLRKNLCGHW